VSSLEKTPELVTSHYPGFDAANFANFLGQHMTSRFGNQGTAVRDKDLSRIGTEITKINPAIIDWERALSPSSIEHLVEP
jgi:hypothetical protein